MRGSVRSIWFAQCLRNLAQRQHNQRCPDRGGQIIGKFKICDNPGAEHAAQSCNQRWRNIHPPVTCEREHGGARQPKVRRAVDAQRHRRGEEIEGRVEWIKCRGLRIGNEWFSTAGVRTPKWNMSTPKNLFGKRMLRQKIKKHVSHERQFSAKKRWP